jgi:hypothetical protein
VCWTARAFSLWALSASLWACQLAGPVVSLSAPVTGVLKHLGLLTDPRLLAVSLFHPLAPQEFVGPRLGGGLFLSQKGLVPYQNAELFHDQSDELRRRLAGFRFKHITQVPTRGNDPFAIARGGLAALATHLHSCESKVSAFESWLRTEEAALRARPAFQGEVHFFLGPLRGERFPELLVVNDGAIGWWIKEGKLRTLETPLPYVRWGGKWRARSKGARFVGLDASGAVGAWQLVPLSPGHFNVQDPMALAPGVFQIEFMRRLAATDW